MTIQDRIKLYKESGNYDINSLAKSLGLEVIVIGGELSKGAEMGHYGSVVSIKRGKQIWLIKNNSNLRTAKFLIAYHIVEYLNNIENSIIYIESLYDKRIYEEAISLIIPPDIEKGTIPELADKYQVTTPIIEYRLKQKIKKQNSRRRV